MRLSSTKLLALLVAISVHTLPDSEAFAQQDDSVTTIYVVRHADRDGKNDALTEAGDQRATHIADMMKVLRPDAVYSTDTIRTRNTAAPTVAALELELKTYGKLTEDWIKEIKHNHRGQSILVVGHSNTSGEIAKLLGGQGDFEMKEDEFDRMFVVTVRGDEVSSVAIQFGEPTGPDR